MKRIGIIGILVSLLVITGCGSTGIQTDFNTALKTAERQKKDVILIFGRSDTDPLTQSLQKDILNSPDFLKEFEKNFIPVFIDLPVTDGAMEEKQLQKNTGVAQRYNLQMFPTVMLLTSDGDVYGTIQYDGTPITPAQLMETINSFSAERTERQDAKKAIAAASGTEKALLIDALYENTSPLYQSLLLNYLEKIPALDPDNTTGLRSKYDFLTAYNEALNLYLEGKNDEAAKIFVQAAKSPYITDEERQSAYTTAISIYASSEDKDADKKITDIVMQIASDAPGAPDYKKEIAKAKGVEKAKLIDELIDQLDPAFQLFLKDFIREVPELDPNDTLGLKGKYEYLQAYVDAQALYEQGDSAGASAIFQQIADGGNLSPEQKQESYHMAAALYPLSTPEDARVVIDLLQKAAAADPANQNAAQINDTIAQLQAMLMAAEAAIPEQEQ